MKKTINFIFFILVTIIFFQNQSCLISSTKLTSIDTIKLKKNQIWDSTRLYKYSVLYTDSNNKMISSEILELKPTQIVWKIDAKQTLVNFSLSNLIIDSSIFPKIPINGLMRKPMYQYQEGAIANNKSIWMHPLRQNQYVLTEIAPFPEVKFPFELHKTWKRELYIYQGFGSFEGNVKSEYIIGNKPIKKYPFGKYECWQINAIGTHNKLGKSSVELIYNEYIGFTEMNYTFYNKQSIKLKLLQLPIIINTK